MRAFSFVSGLALAALLLLPSDFTAFGPRDAQAQFIAVPPGGGGGGGRGGGDFEVYDPCAFGDCFRRRPPPRYRHRGVIVEEDPYVYEDPYFYDEVPEAPTRRTKQRPKPKAQTAKPKPPATNEVTLGQTAGTDYRPDEVLVEFPLDTPQEQIDALAQENNIEQLGSQEIALLNVRLHRWRVAAGQTPEAVAARLRGNANVSAANLNRIYTLEEAQANSGPPQYAADKLRLTEAHAITRGDGVLIALIDSGADKDHPELKDVIAREFDAVGGTFEPHAHGTGMAGAIAGQDTLKSAAPNARILNVRAFAASGKTQDGTTFDVIKGMDWAAQNGARIFNLSFAGPRDPLMSRVVKAAQGKGIVVIAAAGNRGPSSPPLYPAADAGVIAVTATDADDGVMKQANRGRYVTMAAPGVDILLPAPNKSYAISSGTSIATAYVSGVAALILARNPDADGKEVYEILTGTARDLGAKGRDTDFGAGLTDPAAALEMLEPVPMTVSAPVQTDIPAR